MAARIDERFNLKHVHRRLQAVSKVLIVTTFMEDAMRVVLTFSVQQKSMVIAGWQTPILHTLLPVLSLVVQCTGGLLIVMPGVGRQHALGCYILLAWCVWHPLMYRQQTNWEFVLETLTIQGGLLILLSHFMLLSPEAKQTLPSSRPAADNPVQIRANRLQALGRLMIVSIFLYYAFQKVHAWTKKVDIGSTVPDEHSGAARWLERAFEGFIIIALLYMCSLVIIGMQSRWVALLLAFLMATTALYMHPFWMYMFSSRTFQIEGVAGMEGYEVDAFTMADHQRYFFFQTMSTVGALLLLVVHGPGKLSVDEQNGPTQIITTKGGE